MLLGNNLKRKKKKYIQFLSKILEIKKNSIIRDIMIIGGSKNEKNECYSCFWQKDGKYTYV